MKQSNAWRIPTLILTALLTLARPLAAANTDCAAPPGAEPAELRAASAAIARGAPADPATLAARIQRGEAYRLLGRDDAAAADLEAARAGAALAKRPAEEVTATLALGQVRAHQGQTAVAASLLETALAQSRTLGRPALSAASANALGALRHDQGEREAAATLWRQALDQAQAAGDAGLMAAIQSNQSRLAARPAQALALLRTARESARRATPPAEQARLLLTIGLQARQQSGGADFAAATLREAATLGGTGRTASEALGQLGALRAAQGARAAARDLALEALRAAPLDAYDQRYRWEWQLAQLLTQAGDRERAIAAYRRAVDQLQRIRQELPIEYAAGRSSFRETLEPLYLGLADLLLQESARTPEGTARQALLREARATVEQIKLDELRDYFRDRCILPLREELEELAPRAAVLYPVILPDRLELLVSIGPRLYQQRMPVDREQFRNLAWTLALKLRFDRPAENEAAQFYDWLVAPFESQLRDQRVDTIVFVPDGPLRAVPLAALRGPDGRYLIERYAVATVPGLRLLPPASRAPAGERTLLAGLSRPGPVVDELPAWWVEAMVQAHRGRGGRGADPMTPRGATVAVQGGTAAQTLRGVSDQEKIAALALPGVAAEIQDLAALLPARTLQDDGFRLSQFVDEVTDQPYRVVHIASHGLFQGPPEENFVVTYDHKLDMKTLAAALKPRALSRQPIEILVLSACQTAEGDDRTPLGLSGVALQAGARSALGALWPVGDASTQYLMDRFYTALRTPGTAKAQALRQAQQALIADPRYRRPNAWAGFILVGNWL